MNLKRLILPLGVVCALFTACVPYPPNPDAPIAAQNPEPAPTIKKKKPSTSTQKKTRSARESVSTETISTEPRDPKPDTPPPASDFRTGIPIPGKEGFVFNPFTNNPVDVRGIPPGTLVRDPQDADADHKFRVP